MDTYFAGQTLRVAVSFLDDVGDPADPTGLVYTQRIDREDIDTLTYGVDDALVRQELGIFYVDISLAVSGTYAYSFIGTGAVENAIEDSFLVLSALDVEPLVEFTEAKAYLRTSGTDEDSVIHGMLLAIEALIKVNLVTHIIAEEESVYLDGGFEALLLGKYPISEEEGDEVLVHDAIWDEDIDEEFYRLVPEVGQIFYLNEAAQWPKGKKRYLVTFTSGLSLRSDYAQCLSRIKAAELMMLADLYYNRKASTYKDVIDDVSENYELLSRLPKKIEAMLQGLIRVTTDL